MLRAVVHAKALIKRLRDSFLKHRITKTWCIAVKSHGVLFLKKSYHLIGELLGNLNTGVTKTEIKYVLIADLFSPGSGIFR